MHIMQRASYEKDILENCCCLLVEKLSCHYTNAIFVATHLPTFFIKKDTDGMFERER